MCNTLKKKTRPVKKKKKKFILSFGVKIPSFGENSEFFPLFPGFLVFFLENSAKIPSFGENSEFRRKFRVSKNSEFRRRVYQKFRVSAKKIPSFDKNSEFRRPKNSEFGENGRCPSLPPEGSPM